MRKREKNTKRSTQRFVRIIIILLIIIIIFYFFCHRRASTSTAIILEMSARVFVELNIVPLPSSSHPPIFFFILFLFFFLIPPPLSRFVSFPSRLFHFPRNLFNLPPASIWRFHPVRFSRTDAECGVPR